MEERITPQFPHVARAAARPLCTHDLTARARAEYLEMPGLCLTIAQAARLWNVGRDECLEALDTLTRAGFLYRSRDQYLRPGTGRWFV